MVGERLKKIRNDHKLTQQNIADVLGIDRTTYTFYERGTTSPSLSTLYKLSEIYNVTVGYLMGVEDNRPELRRSVPSDAEEISECDPLVLLDKDERMILMCYRVLDEGSKAQATEMLRAFSKEHAKNISSKKKND